MIDKILINNLVLELYIGVNEYEKRFKQKVTINLEMQTNCKDAALTDNINDALDYYMVAKFIEEKFQNQKYNLIETLAENILNALFDKFNIPSAKIYLEKPGAINSAKSVGVKIQRIKS